VAEERPNRREHQDAYMFVGFLALVVLVVVVVLLVRNTWSPEQWGALAAVAASVQALGVLAALWYIPVQMRAAREESRRQRTNELIDRLDAAVFGELQPAVRAVTGAWGRLLWLREIAIEVDGPESLRMVEEDYAKARDAVRGITTPASAAIDLVDRVLVLLGEGRKTYLPRLHVALMRLHIHFLPAGVLDPWEQEVEVEEFVSNVRSMEEEFVKWVREYINDHVSS
jgi:hypothetical protein